ncbi:MAG TPA: preprotein translocase subunit YajC [Jatrophihabitans sp.]
MDWTFVVIIVILAGFYALTLRNRKRQQQKQHDLESSLTFGTEVMTTSGLYGTIVGRNEDDTVQLAIAPGIEVKWALAALRDVKSLPSQYRKGIDPGESPEQGGNPVD